MNTKSLILEKNYELSQLFTIGEEGAEIAPRLETAQLSEK
jgi:hypothetical protein